VEQRKDTGKGIMAWNAVGKVENGRKPILFFFAPVGNGNPIICATNDSTNGNKEEPIPLIEAA
jgi:hypothetical protein